MEGVEENSPFSLLLLSASTRQGSDVVIASLSVLRSSELFVTVGPNLIVRWRLAVAVEVETAAGKVPHRGGGSRG